jgi:hypothetical protein
LDSAGREGQAATTVDVELGTGNATPREATRSRTGFDLTGIPLRPRVLVRADWHVNRDGLVVAHRPEARVEQCSLHRHRSDASR